MRVSAVRMRAREPSADIAVARGGQGSLGAGEPGVRGVSAIRNLHATDKTVLRPFGIDSKFTTGMGSGCGGGRDKPLRVAVRREGLARNRQPIWPLDTV